MSVLSAPRTVDSPEVRRWIDYYETDPEGRWTHYIDVRGAHFKPAIAGELAFEWLFREHILALARTSLDGSPDGGVDFRFKAIPRTVDVKTARKPKYLLVKTVPKPKADYYVLAHYDDDTQRATLLGWETRETMLAQQADDFGLVVPSHYLLRARLRPMQELLDLLEALA